MLRSRSSVFTRPMEVLWHAVRTWEIKCVPHLQGKWTDKRWSFTRAYVVPILIQNGLLGAAKATVVGRCSFYWTTFMSLLSKNQSLPTVDWFWNCFFFLHCLFLGHFGTLTWLEMGKEGYISNLIPRSHCLNGIEMKYYILCPIIYKWKVYRSVTLYMYIEGPFTLGTYA